MNDITYTADPDEIEYVETKPDGTKTYYFDPKLALGHLLINDVLILNTNHWKTDWPEEARNSTVFAVISNDVFGPGADADPITNTDIELVYRMWLKDPRLGLVAWAVFHRKQPPWSKYVKWLQEAGYDIDYLVSVDGKELLESYRHGPTEWFL